MSVFPFPGGPTSSTPLGARAPEARNFWGCRKKSTISVSWTCTGHAHATKRKTVFAKGQACALCRVRAGMCNVCEIA